MPEQVRVGIVGLGGMGQSHARVLSQIEGMLFVAGADPRPACQEAARAIGALAFADHASMLEGVKLDAVIVSSPSNTHGRVVRDCCSRGLHIFCEKPLTTDFSEALSVRDSVRDSEVIFSIGLVLRHSPIYREAKEMIEKGTIGRAAMADCRYAGHMLGRYEYVFSRELGRGLVNEHTIHMIDVMQYLLGPVESVYAAMDSTPSHTEYNASVLMVHEGGAFTSICGSGVSRLPSYARITGLEAEIMLEGNQILILKDASGEHEILRAQLGYRAELEDFRDSILGRRRPLTGIDTAISCARLIEAIYRSAESGSVVRPGSLPD